MKNLKMGFLLFLLCCSTIFANDYGNIMGIVKDSETEEPLIGANVIIKGTATGAATDYEGKYFIQGAEPGVISLSVSYIGYENKTLDGVEVVSGETTSRNISMNKDVVSIEGVKVTAKKKVGSELVTQDLAAAQAHGHPDYLYISGSMVMNGLADVPWDDFDESTDGAWTGTYVMESAGLAMTVDVNGLPATLHVNPPLNSIAFENVDEVIEDDFFTQTDYKGAFSSDSNWLEEWSYLSVGEVLSTDNDKSSIIAQELKLRGNYPNPFNPSTKINFELSGYHDNVTFTVFNVTGQIVNQISFSNTLPGMQVISWNGINSNGASVPSGIYFYQVQAGDLSAMGKMTLVK